MGCHNVGSVPAFLTDMLHACSADARGQDGRVDISVHPEDKSNFPFLSMMRDQYKLKLKKIAEPPKPKAKPARQ